MGPRRGSARLGPLARSAQQWFFEKVRSAAGAMAHTSCAAVQLRGADGLSTFKLSEDHLGSVGPSSARRRFLVPGENPFCLQNCGIRAGVVRIHACTRRSVARRVRPASYSRTFTLLIEARRADPYHSHKSHSFDLRGGGGTTGRRRPGPVSPARPAPRRAPTSAA